MRKDRSRLRRDGKRKATGWLQGPRGAAAGWGHQEGSEKEVVTLTLARTQGGGRQVTGESRMALRLPQ